MILNENIKEVVFIKADVLEEDVYWWFFNACTYGVVYLRLDCGLNVTQIKKLKRAIVGAFVWSSKNEI